MDLLPLQQNENQMCKPVRLQVQDFGPIKKADIVIDKYTVLLGGQGAGKSTLAKLFSLFTWLEKSLSLCTLSTKHIEQYSRFQNVYCKYHRIETFFKPTTSIDYAGVSYDFSYRNAKFKVTSHGEFPSYEVAKVMYVPAERGYLSMQSKSLSFKGMPDSLQAFHEEFKEAEQYFKEGCVLPVNDLSFEYDSLNDYAWLRGKDYKVSLAASSSGFQSLLPLILVTRYLTAWVSKKEGESMLNADEQKRVRLEVQKVMLNNQLSDEVKMAMLHTLSSRFRYSRFVNIVEEPEQNLYPISQKVVLFELLGSANTMEGNQVLLTTHSPYFVNFLTLAVKAGNLFEKTKDNAVLQEKIAAVTPLQSVVLSEHLHIYELKDGHSVLLDTYDNGVPSDSNILNSLLGETNEMFDKLLEIEDFINNGKD